MSFSYVWQGVCWPVGKEERNHCSEIKEVIIKWSSFGCFLSWIGLTLQKKTLSMSIRDRLQNDGCRRKASVLVADGSSRRWYFSWRQAIRNLTIHLFCSVDLGASLLGDSILLLITIQKAACTNMHNVGNVQVTSSESHVIYSLILMWLSK